MLNSSDDSLVSDEIKSLFNSKVIERFASKLKLGENGCIEWTGASHNGGYGRISIKTPNGNKDIKAHRWALQLSLGGVILPKEIHACHHCDNPSCVHPKHLFAGTNKDNIDDRVNKGRSAINLNGAKLNEEKVKEIRNSDKDKKTLCAEYDISKTSLNQLLRGDTWKNVK